MNTVETVDTVDEQGTHAMAEEIEVFVNGGRLAVPRGSSVADVVARFAPSVQCGRGTAVAVGEAVVPTGRWADTPVVAGDRLEVLQAVAGG